MRKLKRPPMYLGIIGGVLIGTLIGATLDIFADISDWRILIPGLIFTYCFTYLIFGLIFEKEAR